jgi:hypothetical protein
MILNKHPVNTHFQEDKPQEHITHPFERSAAVTFLWDTNAKLI